MKARYSNLPHPPSSTPDLLPKDQKSSTTSWGDNGVDRSRKMVATWAGSLWALAAHFVLSVGITIFILIYVEGHYFNVTERTPPVQFIEGTQTTPLIPLQSDVVTILSALIAVLKCVLGAWAGSLCWHIALFLMSNRGLARRSLKILLGYGLLAPNAYSKIWSTWIIGALLLVNLAANLSSPILTGSISWVPTNRLVHGLSLRPIPVYEYFRAPEGYPLKEMMRNGRDFYPINIRNEVGIAWGRNPDRNVLKTVSWEVEGLSINSTLENITLPYFKVHSIRWIENRDEVPRRQDLIYMNNSLQIRPNLDHIGSENVLGTAILVPNNPTNWTIDPMNTTIIHDTRLLVLMVGHRGYYQIPYLTHDLPLNTYIEEASINRRLYVFAWVNFTAGAARCKENGCVVSSVATIRNNTPFEQVEPHALTEQALYIAPLVGVHLAYQNTSLPYPWMNIDDYVEALLVRSYSGSWTALSSVPGSRLLYTRYTPSLASLLARVNRTRVYIWLALQLLVTLLSILFLFNRSKHSSYPLTKSTTLTAFYLDTTDIPGEDGAQSKDTGLLTVEPQGDRFKVKLE